MNDVVTQPGTVALEPPSTVLNPQTVGQTSGGGSVSVSEPKDEEYKPQSIENVLEAENKRLKEEATEADKAVKDKAEKAAVDAKAKVEDTDKKADDDKALKARDEGGKFAKAQTEAPKSEPEKAAAERVAPVERASEGRNHMEPPARFLPEAREKWANVPANIRSEMHRVSQEMEAENAQYKQAHERYSQLQEYDDIARGNGRDLRESLAKVVEVETAMARNPIAGLDAVLREIGPRKADGSPLTLLEVAQHIVQNPQAYHSAASQVPQAVQAQQRNPEIEALRSEIHSMKQEQQQAAIMPEINRFYEQHNITPNSDIENRLVSVLKSGVVEQIYGSGLSIEQRLSEALRMAGGKTPSRSEPEAPFVPAQAIPAAPLNAEAGKKSVRGAPSDGSDTATEETETDLREMLRKEMRKLA